MWRFLPRNHNYLFDMLTFKLRMWTFGLISSFPHLILVTLTCVTPVENKCRLTNTGCVVSDYLCTFAHFYGSWRTVEERSVTFYKEHRTTENNHFWLVGRFQSPSFLYIRTPLLCSKLNLRTVTLIAPVVLQNAFIWIDGKPCYLTVLIP